MVVTTRPPSAFREALASLLQDRQPEPMAVSLLLLSPLPIIPHLPHTCYPKPLTPFLLPSYNNKLILTATQAAACTAPQTRLDPIDIKSYYTPSLVSKPPLRPNTQIHYDQFTEHEIPMPAGLLNYNRWPKLTSEYPDRAVAENILRICHYGARICYKGARGAIQIHLSLASTEEVREIVTTEIEEELTMNRLKCYPIYTALPYNFTAFPLGLIDKSDGSKRRIHHLSFPADESSLINGGIPEGYGTIAYSTVQDAMAAVQRFGNCCQLMKPNFASVFRHIPVSPFDTPLLGFGWH